MAIWNTVIGHDGQSIKKIIFITLDEKYLEILKNFL